MVLTMEKTTTTTTTTTRARARWSTSTAACFARVCGSVVRTKTRTNAILLFLLLLSLGTAIKHHSAEASTVSSLAPFRNDWIGERFCSRRHWGRRRTNFLTEFQNKNQPCSIVSPATTSTSLTRRQRKRQRQPEETIKDGAGTTAVLCSDYKDEKNDKDDDEYTMLTSPFLTPFLTKTSMTAKDYATAISYPSIQQQNQRRRRLIENDNNHRNSLKVSASSPPSAVNASTTTSTAKSSENNNAILAASSKRIGNKNPQQQQHGSFSENGRAANSATDLSRGGGPAPTELARPLFYTARVGLAGGLAGAFGTFLLYPVDAAKTLRQSRPNDFSSVYKALQALLFSKGNGVAATATATTTTTTTSASAARYTSSTAAKVRAAAAAASVTTVHGTGLRHLNLPRAYAGGWTSTLGAIPSSALYFGAYETMKTIIQSKLIPLDGDGGGDGDGTTKSTFLKRLTVHALSAASGNVVSSAVFVPKELIKQQMQFSGGSRSIAQSIQAIVATHGVSGLYRGYQATLMRNVPSAMLRFGLYEELKHIWLVQHHNQQQNQLSSSTTAAMTPVVPLPSWKLFAAGAIAGAVASGIMTPVDVLKTRFSTGTCPVGVKSCFLHILQEGGWNGLYAGAGSRMAFSGAFSAIGFWSFETAKGWLGVSENVVVVVPASKNSNKSK